MIPSVFLDYAAPLRPSDFLENVLARVFCAAFGIDFNAFPAHSVSSPSMLSYSPLPCSHLQGGCSASTGAGSGCVCPLSPKSESTCHASPHLGWTPLTAQFSPSSLSLTAQLRVNVLATNSALR